MALFSSSVVISSSSSSWEGEWCFFLRRIPLGDVISSSSWTGGWWCCFFLRREDSSWQRACKQMHMLFERRWWSQCGKLRAIQLCKTTTWSVTSHSPFLWRDSFSTVSSIRWVLFFFFFFFFFRWVFSLCLCLSHEQALATMRVVLRVQNNRTESHSLPLFWITPVSHLHCSSTHFSFLFSECDHHNTRRFYRQACGNDDRQTKSLLLGFSCVCICVCFCVWVQKLARLLILPKGEKGLKNGVKEAGAKKICKFTESAWKLTYYLSTEICVVWITYKEPWFTDTSTFWDGWPHQTLKYWIFSPNLPFQSSQFSQLFLQSGIFADSSKIFLCRQLEEFCLQSCFCFMSAIWGFVARFQWGFWQGFWTECSSSIESLEWYQTLSKICCFCWFNDERDLLFVVRCCQTIMTTNGRSGTSSKKNLISLGQEKRRDFNFVMLNLSAGEMMGVVVGQISIEVILHISVRLLHL